jgi:anti-sigma-K factor RskA
MDCKESEGFFEAYLLGALDSRVRSRMDSHLETCTSCGARLYEEGETVAKLAVSVPQLAVPAAVKERLFQIVDAEPGPGWLSRLAGKLSAFRVPALGYHPAGAGVVLASLAVVGLVLGGVWFNNRLNQIADENELLNAQVETVVEREAKVMKMMYDQRYLASMTAAPGVSVNMLWGTEHSVKAWGMIACCAVSESGTVALLAVLNLPPLPRDKVYQVWLIKGEERMSAGLFEVDSTGYAQTVIIPLAPMAEFQAIGITVEPLGGSPSPTGTGVLRGDL